MARNPKQQREASEFEERVVIIAVAVGHSYDGRYGCTRCYLYAFEPLDGLRSYSAGVDRSPDYNGFALSQDHRLFRSVKGQVNGLDSSRARGSCSGAFS